jgi:hypothetical protein
VPRSPAPGIPAWARSGCWRVRHCPEKACAVITLPPSLPAQAFALPGHTAAGRVSLAGQHTDRPGNDVPGSEPSQPKPEPVMAVPFPVMSLPSRSASRAPRSQTRPAAQPVYLCIPAVCGNARSCRVSDVNLHVAWVTGCAGRSRRTRRCGRPGRPAAPRPGAHEPAAAA